MSEVKIAGRYARALQRSTESSPSEVLKVLQTVADLFKNSSARRVLESPVMPLALKRELLDYACKVAGADKPFKNFISTVLRAGRVQILPLIEKAYRDLVLESEAALNGDLYSAVELSAEDVAAIEKKVSKIFDKKVTLSQQIKEDILGGVIVKVGNNLLDLSLKSKIDSLVSNALA